MPNRYYHALADTPNLVRSIRAGGDNIDRPVIALNLATASLTITYELIWLPARFILRGTLTSIATQDDLVKICRTYKANQGFAWIAFGLAMIILLFTVYTAVSMVSLLRAHGHERCDADNQHWSASFGDASRRAAPGTAASTARLEAKGDEQPVEATQPSAA